MTKQQIWNPTQVRSEIFKSVDPTKLSSKEKERLSRLMAQTDMVIQEIMEDSKQSIFAGFERKDHKEKVRILNYLFNRL